MKCLILAAGYATRLYPLTENFPKPLLEVGDKTILDWLVDDIDASGEVDEYVVISNHKYAHHFENWAKTKQQKVTVVDDGTDNVYATPFADETVTVEPIISDETDSAYYVTVTPENGKELAPLGLTINENGTVIDSYQTVGNTGNKFRFERQT